MFRNLTELEASFLMGLPLPPPYLTTSTNTDCTTLMQQGWVPHCTWEGKKKLQAGYLFKFHRQPEVLSANQQRLLEFEGEKKHSTQSQAVDGSSGGAKHIAQKPLTHTVRICLIMFVLRNQSHFLVRNFAFLNKKTIPCTDQ